MKLKNQQVEDLNNLVKDVYSKQRSGFVHDAKLRHAELDKERAQPLGRPGKDRAVCEELEFMEDLNSIEIVARQVLLNRLLPFDNRIHTMLDSGSNFRVRHPAACLSAITLRARRQVGFRLQSDVEEA